MKFTSLVLLTLALTAAAAGQGFKVYPGATNYTPPDTEETRESAKALPRHVHHLHHKRLLREGRCFLLRACQGMPYAWHAGGGKTPQRTGTETDVSFLERRC
jgi:hypothetical protein